MAGNALPIGGSLTFTARQDRQAHAALWAPGAAGLQVTTGVRPGPGLDVTVASTTITVTAGAAVVQSAASALAGGYYAWLDASATLTLTAADASNPRSDLVYLRVRDTDEDGSGVRDCAPVYVAGTPAASPVTPTIPAGTSGVVLASITVPKTGSGSPTVSYATRQYGAASGGIPPVPSGLLALAGQYNGQVRFNLSSSRLEWWNSATSAWVVASALLPVTSDQISMPGTLVTGAFTDFTSGQWPAVTMTVPPSGMVEITIGAAVANTVTTSATAWATWRASGALTEGGSEKNAVATIGGRTYGSRTVIRAGLTPGSSLTITPQYNVSAAGTIGSVTRVSDGQLIVKPLSG